MRRIAASLFAAMIVLTCLTTRISADDEDQVKVTAVEAKLTFDGQVVATVKKGEVLTVVSRKGEQIGVKVTRGGRVIVGWISKKDVTEFDPVAEAERLKWEIPPELKDREWKWKRCPAGKKPVLVLPKDWDEASTAPPERQFDKVQDAIAAAKDGEEVVIGPGRYVECIDFKGKAITVRSTNPADAKVVAATVLDGAKKGSVVTLQNKEGYGSVLAGLTITGGTGTPKVYGDNKGPVVSGGGVLCWQASPVVKNCVVTRNEANTGAGALVFESSAYFEDCDFIENKASAEGGGFSACDASPKIRRCRFLRNEAVEGGGIRSFRSFITIERSIICRNTAINRAGGLSYYTWVVAPEIRATNCVIAFNRALINSDGAYMRGDGAPTNPDDFLNCILWGNGADLMNGHASYSCYQSRIVNSRLRPPNPPECKGNIQLNPHFVDPENDDYHLQPWSPCIGAGLDGVNMGAYPDAPAAKSPDTDNDGLPDAWELLYARDLKTFGAADADNDGVSDLEEYQRGTHPLRPSSLIHVRADTDPKLADGTKEHPFPAIQPAIDAAAEGAEVRVAAGAYKGNIELVSKNITLSGGWDNDFAFRNPFWNEFRSTILGTGDGSCIRITGLNGSRVTGFTIKGGKAFLGGGIFVGWDAKPLISECLVCNNIANQGGGISSFVGYPVMQNCVIANNRAMKVPPGFTRVGRGGGVIGDQRTITLVNCTIVGNSATSAGGLSVYSSHGAVVNCVFADNECRWGRDIAVESEYEDRHGIMDIAHSLISTDKMALWVRGSSRSICTRGGGMLEGDPKFVDPRGPDGNPETTEDNDYRLLPGSPCLGAGDAAAAPPLDADGKPRMKPSPDGKTKGSCNMGAF